MSTGIWTRYFFRHKDTKEQSAFVLKNQSKSMKNTIFTLGLFFLCIASTIAQSSTEEQKIIQLSKDKWQWMADKNVDKLEPLFDDKAKFVHMSGTWKKAEELEIIKTGSIWYKAKSTIRLWKFPGKRPSSGTGLPWWRWSGEMRPPLNLQ